MFFQGFNDVLIKSYKLLVCRPRWVSVWIIFSEQFCAFFVCKTWNECCAINRWAVRCIHENFMLLPQHLTKFYNVRRIRASAKLIRDLRMRKRNEMQPHNVVTVILEPM